MKPEIATIHARMAQGGDWREFRDEIAASHNEATTEAEHVTLLEAHHNLVAVAEHSFDPDTYAKLLPITRAEYLMFLNKESMEDGIINPALLDRVTRREVEAGRLDAKDDFRSLAAAGGTVLGDSAELYAHRCKQGDYFFYGMAAAAIAAFFLPYAHVSSLWLIAIGLLIGWYLNERERKRIKSDIATKRA